VHTHEGKLGVLEEGFGPNTDIDMRLAKYQVDTGRKVSWDYTIDMNGDVLCQNDPVEHYSWQAGIINPISLGIELIQKTNGNLYKKQLEQTILLLDFLTLKLGIQRQIPWDKKNNKPFEKTLNRLENGGNDFVGICAHHMITDNRGFGDPGPYIFYALKEAGYELFDIKENEDLNVWKNRQKNLNLKQDGIPLNDTINTLKINGSKTGLWVSRPIDNIL
jgi:hypothetical protein